MASCKTCHGKVLVDGIGPVSASSMSTVGLELKNFINPDLTWKNVSKGYRSGTRRTRKSVSKNLSTEMKLADKSSRVEEDDSVSETEKLGVAVLGHHFGDKGGYVPPKKRRSMFRSPSPPTPQTPPHAEGFDQRVDMKSSLGESSCSNFTQRQCLWNYENSERGCTIMDDKFSEVAGEKPGCRDDFFGIEILAAAACNDSMDDDAFQNEENALVGEPSEKRSESFASTVPSEEPTASLEEAYRSSKESGNQDNIEGPSSEYDRDLSEATNDKDKKKLEESISLPEDRSFWDLNLSMDAWERPCDVGQRIGEENVNVDCNDKAETENINVDHNDKPESTEHENALNAGADGAVLSDTCVNKCGTLELGGVHVVTDPNENETIELEACSGPGRSNSELVPVAADVEDPLMSVPVDATISPHQLNVDQCPNYSSGGGDNIASICESKQREEIIASSVHIELVTEECDNATEAQVDKSDPASPCVPVLGSIMNEINNYNSDTKISAQELDIHQPSEHDTLNNQPTNVVEEMSLSSCSVKCEDTPTLVATVVAEDKSRSDGDCTGSNETLQKSPKNLATSSATCEFKPSEPSVVNSNSVPNNLEKVENTDQYPSKSHDSDKVLIAGMENSLELQAGYDFEDGELRDSDGQWEDMEQVDYDTECEDETLCGLEAECGEKKLDVERGSSSDVTENTRLHDLNDRDAFKDDPVNLKRKMEVADGNGPKKQLTDFLGGSKSKDFHSRADRLKTSKRGLLSRVEVSSFTDSTHKNRYINYDDSYSRDEREAGSDEFVERNNRYTSHIRARSPRLGRIYNTSTGHWNSRRRHSPSSYGHHSSGHLRPKSITERRRYDMVTNQEFSEAAGVSRSGNHICSRQYVNNTNGIYWRPLRRRSPVEKDDSYGAHTRISTAGENSLDQSRFRRYPPGFNRSIRDEYLRHISDDGTEYFSRAPHRIGKRERSNSPHGGRSHCTRPNTKRARSKSRSHSPTAWLIQRERVENSRHQRRSPDLRSDVRVGRERLPFSKRFAADYREEFMSPPRSHISPHHGPRSFEEGNAGFVHFRGRKSPVRMFRQTQIIDSTHRSRRFDSDDEFRPVIRSRRFPN